MATCMAIVVLPDPPFSLPTTITCGAVGSAGVWCISSTSLLLCRINATATTQFRIAHSFLRTIFCATTKMNDRCEIAPRERALAWHRAAPISATAIEKKRCSREARWSVIKHVVNDLDDFAARKIDQEQICPVAHPLIVGRRRRQAEQVPIGVPIIAHQEDRRQERTDRPTLIAPALRIDKWCTPHALERTAAIKELCPAGTG